MNITLSDIMAFASLVVAIYSVIYIRYSVRASKKSNKIAVHTERLKILGGVLELNTHLTNKGPRFTKEEVELFKNTVELSELYFDKEICQELHKILDLVNYLLKMDTDWKNRDRSKPGNYIELKAKRMQGCHDTQNACGFLSEKMKKNMRLSDS